MRISKPIEISPVFGSIFIAATTPLYSVAYFSTSTARSAGSGIEKRDAIMLYSVLGVTKADPWLPWMFGTGPKICFVLKSRRSTRASRPFMSFTSSHRPSYSPLVSDSDG